MKPGEIYKFKKKGTLYKVVDVAKMKNPTTRNWDECVIYEPTVNPDGALYVRERNEFNERFEKLETAE